MHFLSLYLVFVCCSFLSNKPNFVLAAPRRKRLFRVHRQKTGRRRSDLGVSHVALCTRHVIENSRAVKVLARARTATAEFLNGIELYKRFARQEWKTNNHVTRSFLVGSMTLASRFCSSAFVDKTIVVRIGAWPERSVDWMP